MPMATEEPLGQAHAELIVTLQTRVETLLEGIIEFKKACMAQERDVYLAHLENEVRSELRSLKQATESGQSLSLKNVYKLRHLNMPKFEAVWHHAKRCQGVIALRQNFSATSARRPSSDRGRPTKSCVLVDIVAEDGVEWIKVCTDSEKSMLFELAREGWLYHEDDSGPEAEGVDENASCDGRAETEVVILTQTKDLVAAAKERRVRYHHPRVRIILTRIQEGRLAEIDAVIAELKATGATIECVSTSDVGNLVSKTAGIQLQTQMDRISPFERALSDLTNTLNIDCTILIALFSDISHATTQTLSAALANKLSECRHRSLLRQLEANQLSPLLPEKLYNVLVGRHLVCTNEAARVTREITERIGTKTEVSRMRILLGNDGCAEEEARQKLQELSIYRVPEGLLLPIRVTDFDAGAYLDTAPSHPTSELGASGLIASIARQTCEVRRLSELNRSVFVFGWKENITTITRSFMVANAIQETVSQSLDELEKAGGVDPINLDQFHTPKIFVLDEERSLMARPRDDAGPRLGERLPSGERMERRERRKLLRKSAKILSPQKAGTEAVSKHN